MPRPPLLNEPVELTCTLKSHEDRPDSTAQIKLPEGAVLLKGSLEWRGDLKKSVPTTFTVEIAFNKTGHMTIEATSKNGGGLGAIDLNIGTDHSEFGWPVTLPVQATRADPASFPKVEISVPEIPLLNQPGTITCTVSSSIDFPGLTVQIILPMGASVATGKAEWQVDLKANSPVTLSTQVIFTYGGRNLIGWHVTQAETSKSCANPGCICLDIGENQSSFCVEPTPIPPPAPE